MTDIAPESQTTTDDPTTWVPRPRTSPATTVPEPTPVAEPAPGQETKTGSNSAEPDSASPEEGAEPWPESVQASSAHESLDHPAEVPVHPSAEPDRLSAIEQSLADALTATRSFADRAAFYETLVRQLQSRVEALQVDQIQELLGPVLQRLAVMLTHVSESLARAQQQDPGYDASVEFEYFESTIIEMLALVNVDSVGAAPGVPFDRTLHAARLSVTTDDPALDGTIAKVMRQGLVRTGAERAFLPAQVCVNRYVPPPPESPGPSANPPETTVQQGEPQ